MKTVVAGVATAAALLMLWVLSWSRVVWLAAGVAAGAALHAQYQKYRVQLLLLEWKVRCRVKHWWSSLGAPPPPPPKPRGPRHIPKPVLADGGATP